MFICVYVISSKQNQPHNMKCPWPVLSRRRSRSIWKKARWPLSSTKHPHCAVNGKWNRAGGKLSSPAKYGCKFVSADVWQPKNLPISIRHLNLSPLLLQWLRRNFVVLAFNVEKWCGYQLLKNFDEKFIRFETTLKCHGQMYKRAGRIGSNNIALNIASHADARWKHQFDIAYFTLINILAKKKMLTVKEDSSQKRPQQRIQIR